MALLFLYGFLTLFAYTMDFFIVLALIPLCLKNLFMARDTLWLGELALWVNARLLLARVFHVLKGRSYEIHQDLIYSLRIHTAQSFPVTNSITSQPFRLSVLSASPLESLQLSLCKIVALVTPILKGNLLGSGRRLE